MNLKSRVPLCVSRHGNYCLFYPEVIVLDTAPMSMPLPRTLEDNVGIPVII